MTKKMECGIRLYSITTIGPKGQVVIPKDIREKLNLRQGDSVSVLLKDEKYIGIVKNNDLSELMEYVKIEQ